MQRFRDFNYFTCSYSSLRLVDASDFASAADLAAKR